MAQRDVQLNSQLERRARQLKRPQLELQRKQVAVAALLERFRQAIYKNDTLSATKTFLYLWSTLTAKAASSISGFQATEQNYTYVVEFLKERFDKQDVPIQEHPTLLLHLPPTKTLSDVGFLCRLHDHIHRDIAGLKTLGIGSDSCGQCFVLLCLACCLRTGRWSFTRHM